MTGNVAQVFLTDADWVRALRGIHAALRPDGRLVFETRRPERRAWEEWAVDVGPVVLDVPGVGPVEQRREVTDVSLPLVSFRHTYRFLADGAIVTSDSTLRFRDRDEVESSLADTGYRVLDVRRRRTAPAGSSSSSRRLSAPNQVAANVRTGTQGTRPCDNAGNCPTVGLLRPATPRPAPGATSPQLPI
ncbi:hypothetical protein ACFQX7_35630 [Luedemannella flava]